MLKRKFLFFILLSMNNLFGGVLKDE